MQPNLKPWSSSSYLALSCSCHVINTQVFRFLQFWFLLCLLPKQTWVTSPMSAQSSSSSSAWDARPSAVCLQPLLQLCLLLAFFCYQHLFAHAAFSATMLSQPQPKLSIFALCLKYQLPHGNRKNYQLYCWQGWIGKHSLDLYPQLSS